MRNLFERILTMVATLENNSQTLFAKKIGCQQSTFNGYMNEVGQRKIRLTLLEDILRVYPQISRDWLFFGEGDMFSAPARSSRDELAAENTDLKARLAKAQAKVEHLEQQLEAERNLSHELTRRLMLAGVVGADGGTEQKFPKAVQG